MTSSPNRMLLLDALKGIAAQLIVLHHLASYGPLAEELEDALPFVSGLLFDYGRMVVQVFLVIGGYLAARGFAAGLAGEANPLFLLWRRYLRLAPPFIVAMLLAIAGAAVARLWMFSEAIPDAPSFRQFVAHGLLLHGVFDIPSLSAGVWYVAIDLQLFALLLLLLWGGQRVSGARYGALAGGLLIAVMAVAALFYFNRDAAWDAWGVYFFGSYALGAFAWWVTTRQRPMLWFVAGTVVAVLALVVEFRLRLALAMAVAVFIGFATAGGQLYRWPRSPLLAWLGRVSYSVFLVHFPVCLVVNAVYDHFFAAGNGSAMVALLAAWMLSLLAGSLFHQHVESRKRWLPEGTAAATRKALLSLQTSLAKIPRILARA